MIPLRPSGSDDTKRLQAYIDALPLTGGIIQLDAGIYYISEPITIGNGSRNGESSRHGVTIMGQGMGPGSLASNVAGAPTAIKWIGKYADFMFNFRGPFCGGGFERLQLDGAGNVGGFFNLDHVSFAEFSKVVGTGYSNLGMRISTVRGGMAYGSCKNTFTSVHITGPTTHKASAILFTGEPNTELDTCGCTWIGGSAVYGGAPDSFGIRLEGADNNAFVNTDFMTMNARMFGSLVGPSIEFQQWNAKDGQNFPTENAFYRCSTTTRPRGNDLGRNFFWPLCESDCHVMEPMSGSVIGYGSIRGPLGDMMRLRSRHASPLDPTMSVGNDNGGTNNIGGIGFEYLGKRVGQLHGDYFYGLHYRHRELDARGNVVWEDDTFRVGRDGAFVKENGIWRRL